MTCGHTMKPRRGPNKGKVVACLRTAGHAGNHSSVPAPDRRRYKRRWDRENYYGDEPCPDCGGLKGKKQARCGDCSRRMIPPPWLDGGARLEAYMERHGAR